MVEALSTSFQNLFNKYTKSENVENVPQNGKREIYIVPVNKQPDDQQLRFQRPKSRRTFLFDTKILCQSKESKWPIIRQKKLRPLVGQCCSVCIPYTKRVNSKVLTNLKNLIDFYNIGPVKKSMFGYYFDSIKFFYQLKNQGHNYIYDEVLEDEAVAKAINEAAHVACVDNLAEEDDKESHLEKEIEKQRENTRCILAVMSSSVKNWVYKVIGWFTLRMVSLFATSLVVQPSQIERVREAEQSGLPIIYLPLHKSHMDYILLGLVLTMFNIKPPLVAAGENLRVFFFSKLLSYLGAFYIKRNVKETNNDKLYWTILSSYIKNSMKGGHHIEFFLEGARTRSGKCCVPKSGLLSIIVDAYREGVIEDAWIIPVSMNYDRLLEGNFVREQLGQPKKKETFFAAISTFIKALCSHYGMMRVDFNIPYRLRDLYESINKKIELEDQNYRKQGYEISEIDTYKAVVDGMAKHIVYDCWKSTAIMSTNAVCFLLLKKFRNGTTLEQLAIELSLLRDKLSQADRDIGFSGDSKYVVKHALSLLAPNLVTYENTDEGVFVKPVLTVSSLIELSYYGNSLLSHYLHLSTVAIIISELVRDEFWTQKITETKISRTKLIENLSSLIELLQFDFVFVKPCDNLNDIVDRVIRYLEEENVIFIDMLLDEEKQSQNMAKYLDCDSDDEYEQSYVQYDVKYRVNADENSVNKIKFYRSIMMPYLECLAECAESFISEDFTFDSVPEREHVKTILKQMNEDFEDESLLYGESISVDTIKHSFLVFENYNCLRINTKDNVKMLSLVDEELGDLRPNMNALFKYIERFVQYIP